MPEPYILLIMKDEVATKGVAIEQNPGFSQLLIRFRGNQIDTMSNIKDVKRN
jgi:hypothetical protein